MNLLRPALVALALAPVLASCVSRSTQRWPGPMRASADPLPAGDTSLHQPGPEEVSVHRHADPVQVRPAGALQGFPLSFFEKRARLTAGGAVIVSPGGRSEVLWSDGGSIVLFGEAVGWVGSPSRGEPLFEFQELDRARIDLQAAEQVRLLGGALLAGDSGPYLLEHFADQTISVHNQSKGAARVTFRDESIELAPGQIVRLPLLSSGGGPREGSGSEYARFQGPGFLVRLAGEPDCVETPQGVRVSASGAREAEALAFGVHVRLQQGESVHFSEPRPAPPAATTVPPAQ